MWLRTGGEGWRVRRRGLRAGRGPHGSVRRAACSVRRAACSVARKPPSIVSDFRDGAGGVGGAPCEPSLQIAAVDRRLGSHCCRAPPRLASGVWLLAAGRWPLGLVAAPESCVRPWVITRPPPPTTACQAVPSTRLSLPREPSLCFSCTALRGPLSAVPLRANIAVLLGQGSPPPLLVCADTTKHHAWPPLRADT
jgi:hypothetical protein